jgi:hypothetical protein
MNENINILGVFHDGTIVESQRKNSTISFRIDIKYLREMFNDKGSSIWVHLDDCDKVEFQPYASEKIITTPAEIARAMPEILYVNEQEETASIECAEGILRLRYKKIRFTLDTGEEISTEQLENASKKYWDNLE